MLQKNPESWSLDIELRPVQSQVLIKTLIDALETNYTLTSIQGLDAFPMSSEEKALIHSHLIRNRLIKDAKLGSIAFTQGFTQMESAASCLPMELHRLIFEHMLPSNLDVDRFFREVKQALNLNQRRQVRKEHALTLIDREIARLSLSNAEHNKLLSTSFDKLYTNSDEKIKALLELKTMVTQETTHIDQAIRAWELTYAPTLSVHRSIACRFFAQGPTRSQGFIQSLKETLGIDTKNNSGVEAEADNLTP